MAAKVATPQDLGTKARKFWRQTTTTFELRADEHRLLEDACREIDIIERLQKEMDRSSLIVEGSMGQPVANQLLAELRLHRSALKGLLAAIDWPDDEEGEGRSASASARDMANARWRKRGA